MLYYIKDLGRTSQILIPSHSRQHERYPFTDENIHEFFANFVNDSFSFEGAVKSIFIAEGLAKPPNQASYAFGYLVSYPIEEYEKRDWKYLDDAVGSIHFDCCPAVGIHEISVSPKK